jgi:transcription initiation factor TFIIIB Brf1 subunit/transcription initiation factor TFIIB
MNLKECVLYLNNKLFIRHVNITKKLKEQKTITMYKKFQEEFEIDESAIIDAENLHLELLEKNPFKYESFYLMAAVCFYAISHMIPKNITLEDIERVSHIKKEEIAKCYNMILEIE